jgi:hypothetical protein
MARSEIHLELVETMLTAALARVLMKKKVITSAELASAIDEVSEKSDSDVSRAAAKTAKSIVSNAAT